MIRSSFPKCFAEKKVHSALTKAGPNRLQEASRRPLTLVQHLLEPIRTAVIRIRYARAARSSGIEITEESEVHLRIPSHGTKRHQIPMVLLIHGEHVVETLEIDALELTRAGDQLKTAPRRVFP